MSMLVTERKNRTESKTRTENDHCVWLYEVYSLVILKDVSAEMRTKTLWE